MRYAKLIDGDIHFPPKKMKRGDSITYNPPVEMILEEGYKPILEVPCPETPEGYRYEPVYEDLGDYITYEWVLIENEPTAEELLDILLGEI